jgi:prefoldin subunit 5
MRELDDIGRAHNQVKSAIDQLKGDRHEINSRKRKIQDDIERYKVRIQSIQQSIEVNIAEII